MSNNPIMVDQLVRGKGCVNVKFADKDEMNILFQAINDICKRVTLHQIR